MTDTPNVLGGVRSILKTTILDEHKWAKVHDMAVDAVILDLEDSVSPERKNEARARVAECIDNPVDLGSSIGLPRVNSLDTQWGYEDLCLLAQHAAPAIIYPKVQTAKDVAQVR